MKVYHHLELANEFKESMEGALEEAKATLAKSKDDMTKYYNWRWTLTPDYKPGDKVYLDASDIQTNRPLRKLLEVTVSRYYCLCPIFFIICHNVPVLHQEKSNLL